MPDFPNSTSASGIWTLKKHKRLEQGDNWPVYGDPHFKNVSLLINSTGPEGSTNNVFVDSSSNNFSITRNGNTTQGSFSPFGSNWSNYFDGSGDYLTLASNSAFALPGDFTVECWVYLLGNSSLDSASVRNAIIASTQQNAVPTDGFTFQISGNSTTTGTGISFEIRVSGTNQGYGVTKNIPQQTWNHIAFVRSGTTVFYYLNGIQIGTSTGVTQSIPAGSLTIGGQTVTNYLRQLNGYISNLRLVKGTAVYTTNFTPPISPLTSISGTSLLTCITNRFQDLSTNNFAITANGNTSVSPWAPFARGFGYDANIQGGSMYFDGTGDTITVADSATLEPGNQNFCIEVWIYPTITGDFYWAGKGDATTAAGSTFSLSRNLSSFYIGGATYSFTTSGSMITNQWNHYVLCRNGGTASVFINGVRIATNATLGSGSLNNTSNVFTIGGYTGTILTGYISNFRYVIGTSVYDPTLSTITSPTAPLSAVSGTSLLLKGTQAAIVDLSGTSTIETVGQSQTRAAAFPSDYYQAYFDGTEDYLSIPTTNVNLHQNGDWTYEGWIYYVTMPTTGYQNVFGQGVAGQNSFGLMVANAASNTWSAPYKFKVNQANLGDRITGTTVVVPGVWYHFAVVRSSGVVKLYVNGVMEGTPYSNSTDLNFGGSPFTIGNNSNCYISDFRFTQGVARYKEDFIPPPQTLLPDR